MQYRRIGGLVRAAFIGALALVIVGCNGSDESSSQALRNDNPLTISGSIGDGPVVDATVTVLDSRGESVVAGVSNDSAGYEITVPAGTSFPITVSASGGTDIVSGLAPDFDFKAVLLDPTTTRVNVSPYSTLALAIAHCDGRVTNAAMSNAWTLLHDHLSMGMDPTRVPDPTSGVIDATNVADIVLANEALGETLRRTEAALAGTSAAADAATLLERIGCDLTDGMLDGAGGHADARTAATFVAAGAGVMIEVIGGTLHVNGSDAMGAMDQAIQTVLPGADASVTTLSVPVSNELVNQAGNALTLMMSSLPDEDVLLDYAAILGSVSAAQEARSAVNAAMNSADAAALDGLATRVAGGDDSQVALVTEAAHLQKTASPPIVSFAATPETVTAGGTARLSWSSTNAQRCKASGDWSGLQPSEGSFVTAALQTSASFGIRCIGLGGVTAASAVVQVGNTPPPPPPAAPVVSLGANPASVTTGGTSMLTWSATNATTCSASGAWSGAKTVTGTQSVGPLSMNSNFTLACSGPGGSASTSAMVTVQQPPAAPTLTFVASPLSVASGANSTLTWSSANATSCVASGDWTGARAASGSLAVGPLTSARTYTLACSGAGGTVTRTANVTIAAPGAPTVSFAAVPTSVASGGASQLTWSSTNATSCTASGSWTGARATSGTQTTGALTANASYTLTCTGAGGTASQTAAVTLLPAPTLTFAAAPTSIASGASSQLTWSTTNATGCTASGGWTGTRATSGTLTTGALTANASYTLTCTGSGGSIARTAAVTLLPAPTLTLAASPTSVQSGSASQLTWSSSNATACTASGGWSGARATSGTASTGALTANASYTLTCTGSGGSIAQTAAVTVSAAAPTLTLSASPTSVQSGASSQLTWSTTNATSCTASGAWTGARGTSGTQSTGALTANSSFTLACAGTGGNVSQTGAVTVTAGTPSVTLSANPVGVARNGSTTLTWAGTNVTSCAASGGWSGTLGVSGTQGVGPLTQDTTYSLNCSGGSGNAVAMLTVALREAMLSWQAPTRNVDGTNLTNLSGYKIYYGTSSHSYTQTVDVAGATTTQWTLSLAPGTYFFALAAVDSTGAESSRTNEVSKTIR